MTTLPTMSKLMFGVVTVVAVGRYSIRSCYSWCSW